ncbi:MAG TPA: type II toxin-antitoxin system VapC family toxin [Spirochaetia bacterium]|nr:type II toxin-antitoxin system VapC family toxin [Spirochaetales bacterium]HRW23391.1 type II toxin-antitoxin system VapC family toxin [Spirochaetia bacterium]
MNVVDSSCWLEFFAGSKVGEKMASVIEDMDDLVVPSITLYEVFKKLITELDEDSAILAVAHMKQGKVVDLDSSLAVLAAKLGKENQLAMADSIIYATSRKYNATLWTQDKHFKELENIQYFDKAR